MLLSPIIDYTIKFLLSPIIYYITILLSPIIYHIKMLLSPIIYFIMDFKKLQIAKCYMQNNDIIKLVEIILNFLKFYRN